MSAIVRAQELGRWYGQVVGLSDLTVDVDPGITGLLGPNGAGKSTFLKLIAGELRPSRGDITVLGLKPFANRALYRRIGFCPQQDALYPSMTGRESVRFLLRLAGMSKRDANEAACRALEKTGMTSNMDRRVSTYSKGMRQRTKIAQAIGHDPELLVMDEPLTGLDPVGRRDVFNLLHDLGSSGVHVLISSHVLHEIEALTDQIILVHRGRLLAQGSINEVRELLNRHPRCVELVAAGGRSLAQVLVASESVRSVSFHDSDRLRVEVSDLTSFHSELTALAASGSFGIRSLQTLDESLEAVFDYLVG